MTNNIISKWLLLIALIALIMSGCGVSPDEGDTVVVEGEESPTPTEVATLRPTFTATIDTTPASIPTETVVETEIAETPTPASTTEDTEATATPDTTLTENLVYTSSETILEPTETPTLPSEETVTPTLTVTPTASLPSVTVNTVLNVRSGPGVNYDLVGQLETDSTALITGRNEASSWWQIVFPVGSESRAWISADYGQAQNATKVALADIPPTPTPGIPTATPVPVDTPTPVPPTPPAVDFVVKSIRLWSNEENGGTSPGGSVQNCGYGHHLHVLVEDPQGNPVDGVILRDSYDNVRQGTGSHGPGRTQFIFWSNGYQLEVIEYPSLGRPVTSETSALMSVKGDEIPIPWLMQAHYCASEGECIERINGNLLCRGHYSYDIVFQRTW